MQQNLLPLVSTSTTLPRRRTRPNYPADPATQAIVTAASHNAEVLGAVHSAQIDGPFNRAKLANGATENRGGESTLGNLVAEVQQQASRRHSGLRLRRSPS